MERRIRVGCLILFAASTIKFLNEPNAPMRSILHKRLRVNAYQLAYSNSHRNLHPSIFDGAPRGRAPNAADFGKSFWNGKFRHNSCACEVGLLRICHYC